jgi:hypothetical protein
MAMRQNERRSSGFDFGHHPGFRSGGRSVANPRVTEFGHGRNVTDTGMGSIDGALYSNLWSPVQKQSP